MVVYLRCLWYFKNSIVVDYEIRDSQQKPNNSTFKELNEINKWFFVFKPSQLYNIMCPTCHS